MALETASYVANLVTSNPDGGDARSTADDHLRLIKSVLVRTFPKLDGAVSLSAAQVMYLNDLSASVQLQLNQLRDGSATANNAVNARFANSASTAAFVGTIPAARVADIDASNVFTAPQMIRGGAQQALRVAGGFGTPGTDSFDFIQDSAKVGSVWNRANAAILFGTNNTTRMTIAADGAVTFNGPITGTISNATNAANATNATNANNATNASFALFANSASSAALLSGLAPSDVANANTIAQRNSSGYLFASYFNQSSGNEENPAVSQVIVTNGTDGYFRKSSIESFGHYISARNITDRAGTNKTLSSSAPSGSGSNGDIWYQYA